MPKYKVQFWFAGREWSTDVETDDKEVAIEHYKFCIESHPETPRRIIEVIMIHNEEKTR